MRYLIVVGRFDEDGGRPSKIGQILSSAVVLYNSNKLRDIRIVNGGYLKQIKYLVQQTLYYEVVLWFPEVITDDQTKWVNQIKACNQRCILVTSKSNVSGKYELPELIQKALGQKANLFIEIQKREDQGRQIFVARVLDPLGNMFLDWTENFSLVSEAIVKRVEELQDYTRVSSFMAGEVKVIPNNEAFLDYVWLSADRINSLIPVAKNTTRFVGNASFCDENFMYITKRNIDKTNIVRENFVAVDKCHNVSYYGNDKPSIDAPIHLQLYKFYPKIKYIIHGHVYLAGMPYTDRMIPCGALEEADEIFTHKSSGQYTGFGINLKGHGFIVLSDSIKGMECMMTHMNPRPMPEWIGNENC